MYDFSLQHARLSHKFTGKERDSESNLDNFGARYDSLAMGRFMSPDPDNAGADPTNPQSWNMYAYVINNPLAFVDPDGRACVQDTDGNFHDDNSGGQSCSEATSTAANDQPSVIVYADSSDATWAPAYIAQQQMQQQQQSGFFQRLKQALVCAAAAPLIGNSFINGGGPTTTSAGGTFGVTVGPVLVDRDLNFNVSLNGDSQGNASITYTTGQNANTYAAAGFGYTAGATMATSGGTVSQTDGAGKTFTFGAGPVAGTVSRNGSSLTVGEGAGARYSAAYDSTKTKTVSAQVDCLSVAIDAISSQIF
jgi:RHS repeat-associated protein